MAETVVTSIRENGYRNFIFKYTCLFVDNVNFTNSAIITLAMMANPAPFEAPIAFNILQVRGQTTGVDVKLDWEGTTNSQALILPSNFWEHQFFDKMGGLTNTATVPTGNLLLTTLNAVAGAKIDITIWCKKVYNNSMTLNPVVTYLPGVGSWVDTITWNDTVAWVG